MEDALSVACSGQCTSGMHANGCGENPYTRFGLSSRDYRESPAEGKVRRKRREVEVWAYCLLSNQQDRQVLEATMKVTCDPHRPCVILDYDSRGNIVTLEMLDASQRIENPRSVAYAVVG